MIKIKRKKRIFFSYDKMWTFCRNDIGILSERYEVKPGTFWKPFDMLSKVFNNDLYFAWFGHLPGFFAVLFAKLFKKPSVVVAGGFDVVNEPKIPYGVMIHPIWKYFARWTFKHADLILAVSDSTVKEILVNTEAKKDRIRLVYNGIKVENFKPKGRKDGKMVVTIGGVDKVTLRKKGLETFVKTAGYLPDYKFILIGPFLDKTIGYLKSIAPPNVEFTGAVKHERVAEYLQKARVYCQLSAHESFGCAMTEAMLCECVPVVTNKAALPEVVGNTGFYVAYDDTKAAATAIKKAAKSSKGRLARKRVIDMFPLKKRRMLLLEEIEKMLTEIKQPP